MTTITKERLLTIKQWRETYGPGSNVVLPAEEAEELARIALASLEAKPIGAFHIAEQQVDGTSDYLKDGEWPIDNGIIEVYAAPPVPVVPEEKPMPNPLSMYAVDAVAAIAEVRGWNACRAAMLQSGNFRENKNSSTNNFREIAETSTNYPVIPSEVLSAILKVAKIRADFDDFDGDRRGIGDCLDEAEQELIVTINKYASQLAAEPIATNDVREQTAVPPIQADVAQAIENLKQKLVECNRYNYCADAVKGVEDACRAVSYSQADNQPASGNQAAESNRDNEWTGNPDIDNAIIMLDRIDTLENCDDDRIEAVKAVLRRLAGNYPVIPDGWISCSERMPENIPGSCKEYLVFDGLNNKVHHDYWVVPDGDSAPVASFWNHYGAHVTHWMPLPEPPQEAK
ncbi:TPA: DUF551 domain-containing protein [Escherichia coli]|nr:DUF551 domain-containing protein [Escherichia coli]UND56320.1 DUF551 domain-containing protein [Escherichia coli]UVY04722.1 MAG: Protein of unknown function (DUF551) [Bacteriophage sp.]HAM9088156.1 DUF551 domain-containing protein [Escherichia coli]HCY1980995.1 DUF551 domain-containing protein [Escherichia coli]